MRKHITLGVLTLLTLGLYATGVLAQDSPILLNNPSFEDFPRHSHAPVGWYDCGFPNESAPDVHPNSFFEVSTVPQDGDTYLGLVVRDNDTWEAVSQRLSTSLQKGKCYEFKLHLARSEKYWSMSQTTRDSTHFNTPVKIRIYGGFGYCDKQYLLAESRLVIHTRWLEYAFKFEPIDNFNFLSIEAFYKTPSPFPYNGNVLIDNASAIVPIPCDEPLEEEATTAETPVKDPEKVTVTPKSPMVVDTPEKKPTSTPTTSAKEPETKSEPRLSGVARKELKVGQTLKIENLNFKADSTKINEASFVVLDGIAEFLKANTDIVVEIGGHTNDIPLDYYCDRLSTARAKAVSDYLFSQGIDRKRLTFKGYGKRQPIADNKSVEGRKANQRVEVKIISMTVPRN